MSGNNTGKVIETVGAVLFESDKVLLVKHSEYSLNLTGSYGLPSGHLMEGETEEQA